MRGDIAIGSLFLKARVARAMADAKTNTKEARHKSVVWLFLFLVFGLIL